LQPSLELGIAVNREAFEGYHRGFRPAATMLSKGVAREAWSRQVFFGCHRASRGIPHP
jgi:hypothetical protein